MSEERVVIRDNDYYGGSIYVENLPDPSHGPYPIVETRIVWEAYQGGTVTLVLQSVEELEQLGRLLLSEAEAVEERRRSFKERR